MTSPQTLVPEIRFEGFSSAWERHRLSEFANFSRGNGLSWADVQSDGVNECILYGNLYTDYGMIAESVKYRTNLVPSNPAFSQYGDVLIPGSDTTPTGLARATSIEKTGVLLGGDINILRPNGNVNGSCLSLAINANKSELIKLIKGITVRHIHNDDIKDVEVAFPVAKDEQEKLVGVFKKIDYLINLHQRKQNHLKSVKKSMLEKMFPRDGANVPEIRFAGFTNAWEQRKLGELVQFSKGTGYSKADLKEFGTPIILYGRLYTKYETVIVNVDTFADAKQGSVYSRGGEIIVPASGETAEDISIASVVEKSGVLLGGDLNIITPSADLDSAFLAISISNGKPHEDMAKMAQGKSVVHLHNTDLEKIDLAYPSHEEQTQISGFFRGIDNLITLHQCKCDKLKEIKNSLLQKMFV